MDPAASLFTAGEVIEFGGPCWIDGAARREGKVLRLRIHPDLDVEPTRAFLRAPPTWANSDPVRVLLSELSMDPSAQHARSHRSFLVAAHTLPVALVVTLGVIVGFGLASTLVGAIVGFVLRKPWDGYVERIRQYLASADSSGTSPWEMLLTMARYATRPAVRKVRMQSFTHRVVERVDYLQRSRGYEGTDPVPPLGRSRVVRVSRPRHAFHRWFARRLESYWERRVSPVAGSFPPEWVVPTGNHPFRWLARLRLRFRLVRLERVLLLEARCDREVVDALDRFRYHCSFQPGRRSRRSHLMTGHAAGQLLAATLVGTDRPTGPAGESDSTGSG